MSLINDMLKDLEKRRSRDLETSDSLSNNITWETSPNLKPFNWLTFSVILILITLVVAIAYLLWDRTSLQVAEPIVEKKKVILVKKNKPSKNVVKKEIKTKNKTVVKKKVASEASYNDTNETMAIDVEETDDTAIVNLKKKHHPLSNQQLAEIAYKKGYKFLQQGRMHQGKQLLREALSLYTPHIKAREMLAGIHIKSGRFILAAELLKEGIKVVPNYPLFTQLYARVLLEQSNPHLAIKVLEQGAGSAVMNIEPDYFALLAATYQRVKKHEKAIEIYFKLVRVRPNTGIWWLGLAISLEKSGKAKEALEAYQRAQKTGSLKTGLVKFTNNRVSALQEIGFPEK